MFKKMFIWLIIIFGYAITSHATTTNQKIISLEISAVDPEPGSGITFMRFSLNAGKTWSNDMVYSSHISELDFTSPENGGDSQADIHKICVQVQDGDGNWSDIMCADILYDITSVQMLVEQKQLLTMHLIGFRAVEFSKCL